MDHRICREFYEKGTKIELMMNPNDPDYAALHACLYSFLSAEGLVGKYSANPEYVEVCQRILKREWEVLKQAVERPAGRKLKRKQGSPSRLTD